MPHSRIHESTYKNIKSKIYNTQKEKVETNKKKKTKKLIASLFAQIMTSSVSHHLRRTSHRHNHSNQVEKNILSVSDITLERLEEVKIKIDTKKIF